MTVVESPHVPTRSASDNSNAAASTAYVTAAIAAIPPPAASPIPAGTAMVFYQASAPSGWTSVALNDRALRVVSAGGTGGTGGGSNAFSTVFAQSATGGFTLSTNEIPSHAHTVVQQTNSCGASLGIPSAASATANINTSSVGGGGSHSHSITMSITYSDVIVCTKN